MKSIDRKKIMSKVKYKILAGKLCILGQHNKCPRINQINEWLKTSRYSDRWQVDSDIHYLSYLNKSISFIKIFDKIGSNTKKNMTHRVNLLWCSFEPLLLLLFTCAEMLSNFENSFIKFRCHLFRAVHRTDVKR